EIGAGQEVAHWFLTVGGASGTVAKTISAYDKEVSVDLYGRGTGYVSQPRVFLRSWIRFRRGILWGRTNVMAGWDCASCSCRGERRATWSSTLISRIPPTCNSRRPSGLLA